MVYLLMHDKRCPECNKAVESSSGSESWHDECWQEHHKTNENCTKHDYCKRALKEDWA